MPLATVIQSRRRNNVIHYQATHTTKKLTVDILLPLACSWEHRNYSAVFSEEFDEYNQPLLAAEIWVDDRDEVVYVEMNRCTGEFTLRCGGDGFWIEHQWQPAIVQWKNRRSQCYGALRSGTPPLLWVSACRHWELFAMVGDGAVPGQATRNLVKKKVVDEEKYLRNKELLSARTGISLNLIQPYTVAITELIVGIDNNPFAVFKFWKPPAPPMKFSWPADAQNELCRPCVAFGKKHYREGIERLWKELPSFLRSY
ncbi:hypothetical protein B0H16DRAFT_1466183 [Mycena metata]|uniref:Uncharacterized protein n=1 Tax=Mycena metata TaxID=1033252 RepID=A0AAD7I8P2_9AGAR|nr:hypothetical protein B0H16DRAFT_1466183 [Mycena metata]